jgi:Site-specific recombinase XerD
MLSGIVTKDIAKMKEELLVSIDKTLPNTLTLYEINRIRTWIDERWKHNNELRVRNRAIFELLFDGALRKSELLGIRLKDIDFDNGFIKITVEDEDYRKAWEKGKTETAQKTGQRVIAVGSITIDWLNKYVLLYRPKEAIKIGHGFLFCNIKKPYKGQPFTKTAFESFIAEINKPISENGCGLNKQIHAHMLRHTWASMALEDGVPQKTIQDQLGHKNPDTTAIYQHVTPAFRKRQLDEWRQIHPERYNYE